MVFGLGFFVCVCMCLHMYVCAKNPKKYTFHLECANDTKTTPATSHSFPWPQFIFASAVHGKMQIKCIIQGQITNKLRRIHETLRLPDAQLVGGTDAAVFRRKTKSDSLMWWFSNVLLCSVSYYCTSGFMSYLQPYEDITLNSNTMTSRFYCYSYLTTISESYISFNEWAQTPV